MRTCVGLVIAVVVLLAPIGCSTQRMSLTKNEPPKNAPEEQVRYGNPWSKKKPSSSADEVAGAKEMPADLKEQLAEARAANTEKKTSAAGILQRAAAAEARGDLDDARAAYLEVVATEPNHVEAHHRLGVIADRNGDPQTADEHYARAYAANPKDADLLSDMGYSNFLRGRYDVAERRLKEALEHHPYHRAAQNNLALVYGKQGNYDGALAMFRQTGTESDAQKNIRKLFPSGRPGGDSQTALARAENTANPLPVTPNTPGQAPPFPAEFDQPNGNASLAMSPQPMNNGQGANMGMMQPANPVNNPMTSMWPGGNAASAPSGMSVAAKPQENVEFWKGNLGQNPPPATSNMATNPANPAAPWSNFPGAPPLPGQNPGMSTNMAANSGLPPNWPNSNTLPGGNNGAFGSGVSQPGMSDIQPANHQDWALDPGSNALMPGTNANHPPANYDPAQATRWAAQMGLGTGPGSMFPAMNSPASAAPAWNQPSTSTYPSNGQTQWAYAETPAAGTATPANNMTANWSLENSATATSPWGVPPTAAPNAQPPVAPASPWNDVNTTSAWDRPWSTGTTVPANMTTPGPANAPPATFAEVPAWPANGGSGAAMNVPMSNNGTLPVNNDWPVISPGTGGSTSATNARPTTAPVMNSNSGTTSVPNWPYAPTRP